MHSSTRWTLAVALAAASATSPAATIDLDGVKLDDSTQVGGRVLTLNGAGIGQRLIFKVYAIGLYLLERKSTVQDILGTEEPRRVAIVMLRDVSGADFRSALGSSIADRDGAAGMPPEIVDKMMQLAAAISTRPGGLHRGDTLTFDWVPEVGTVVQLNRAGLFEAHRDKGLYNALLNIWLGAKPTDPSLKKELLGQFSRRQVVD
jgi:hypothetical protein